MNKLRKIFGSASAHAVALLLTALYLLPLLYMVMVSLIPEGESTTAIPSRLAWENYPAALSASTFDLFFANSVIVSVVSALSQIVLSCMAGYALAKLPVKSGNTILVLLIGLLVLPPEIVMVPLFVMTSRVPFVGGNDLLGAGGVGMLDTFAVLALPHMASALAIFLMRQFYKDLPDEMGQAARVDGAGEFRIFASIYTPLTLPAVAVVTVLAFQSAWNDFLWPLIQVRSNDMRTLQLGMSVFYQENSTQWSLLMAIVILVSIPVIVIFVFGQRYFTSGISAGAVK
ncbi:MAG: carbohydrate ABC transporter permease [Propionibacteriaceae bacterium]|nr:carbohydrate ABC transporter permease [Propionibacteriaceae bacterium]